MAIPAGFAQHVSGFLIKLSDQSGPYSFDGTNTPVIVPASAVNTDTAALLTLVAASVSVSGADQTNNSARGIKVVIDITAITGVTPTLTVIIQGKDAASGKYYNMLTSAGLSAVATTTLEIYPAITTTGNVSSGVSLPRTWRVQAVISGTTPAVTATVGASLNI